MKKFSKKGILLFAGAMALCAFVLPSVASAASWTPIGQHTTLDSPNIGFTSTAPSGTQFVSSCTRSSFTADVLSASNLSITSGTFGGVCTATLSSGGADVATCTATAVGTRFPWSASVPTTNNVTLSGVHIDVLFENLPGDASTRCAAVGANGLKLTLTGTLTGGVFSNREIVFTNAEGLVSHSLLGNGTPITTRGTISSTQDLTTVG